MLWDEGQDMLEGTPATQTHAGPTDTCTTRRYNIIVHSREVTKQRVDVLGLVLVLLVGYWIR